MLTKNHRRSIDVDPEWTRLQEDVIASPWLRKKRRIDSKIWDVKSIRMQSFELFRLYSRIYSLTSLQLKSPQKSPYTKFGYCSIFRTDCHFIYLEMRDEGESSSPSSSRPTWHCPLVTSCGRKFHISIHTQTTTEARESSYIRLDSWTQTAGNSRDLLL